MNKSIAVGTKVFKRVDKLETLLDSIPRWVQTVYVADDGKPSSVKNEVYNREFQFSLRILNLEYDTGLGGGRKAIVEEFDEDYLLIVDPDHCVPNNAQLLYEQLQERPEIGGIGGALVEPEQNRLYCEAQDFSEEINNGKVKLVRGPFISESKSVNLVAGAPLINFDFIPNAALFRHECLQEWSWDSEYIIEGEHVDFYVAHWKHTDWDFAVSPSVQFPHYPGGDTEYILERNDSEKALQSREYFLEKWGYEEDDVRGWSYISIGSDTQREENNMSRALEILRNEGFIPLYKRTYQYLQD